MTQIAAALRKAGYETTEEKLTRLAREVLGLHPDPRGTAAAEALYARAVHEADLLAELFKPYRSVALRQCLLHADDEIREEGRRLAAEEQEARGGGRPAIASREQGASATRPRESGGQVGHDSQSGVAAVLPLTPASIALARAEARREAQEHVGEVMRKSRLDTFHIDGVPLGKTNCGHVRSWARARGQEARWLEMLVSNLPAQFIVGDYVTPERADACWLEALEQGAAA